MLDRQARARQAITGESYAKAFTEVYTAPENIAIKDGAQYDHLAKAHDSQYGTRLSSIPLAKAAPPYDPLAKAAEIAEFMGPNHAKLHSMAADHQRAHSGMSYESAYSHLYSRVENAPLREQIKAEHMKSTMAGFCDQGGLDSGGRLPAQPELGKTAAAVTNDASPGSAHTELNWLVIKRMKGDPKLSYERAFTTEYLLPENRTLKSRYDSEPDCAGSVQRATNPAPAFR